MNEIILEQPYKYKDICKIFGEDRMSGSAIQNQIKRWQKTYEMEKIGKGQYIFHKEYSEEEIKQNEIRGAYLKLFSCILSNLLVNSNDDYVSYSTMEILNKTKMVNQDYAVCRYNINDSSQYLDTDPDQLENFIKVSHNLLSRLVKDMLYNLEDKSLIIVRRGYRLYKNNIDYTTTKDVIFGSEDEKDILSIEHESLKEVGAETLKDVYKNDYVLNRFKKATQSKCRSMFGDWDGYYTVYHMTLNKSGLIEYNIETYKELNNKIQSKLLNSTTLKNIDALPKLVDATINMTRPYKIKEALKEYFSTV